MVYVYFEGEPGRRSAAKLLTKDEDRDYARGKRWPAAFSLLPKHSPPMRLAHFVGDDGS